MTKASKNNNVSEDMLKNAYEHIREAKDKAFMEEIGTKTIILDKNFAIKSEYEKLVEENEKLKLKSQCFDLLNEKCGYVKYQGEGYFVRKIFIESNEVELAGEYEHFKRVALDDFLNEVMDSDCKKGELYDY